MTLKPRHNMYHRGTKPDISCAKAVVHRWNLSRIGTYMLQNALKCYKFIIFMCISLSEYIVQCSQEHITWSFFHTHILCTYIIGSENHGYFHQTPAVNSHPSSTWHSSSGWPWRRSMKSLWCKVRFCRSWLKVSKGSPFGFIGEVFQHCWKCWLIHFVGLHGLMLSHFYGRTCDIFAKNVTRWHPIAHFRDRACDTWHGKVI